jgi:hypothetical protein
MGSKIGAEKARLKYLETHGEDAFKIAGSKGGKVSSEAKKEAARVREAKKRALKYSEGSY